MKTDRELLELAAKANGGLLYVEDVDGWIHIYADGNRGAWWNPLKDDGDTLRLACKLFIQIVQDRMGFVKVGWSVGFESGAPTVDGRGPWYWKEWLADHDGNREAATRRAIVRAAAAIGETM